MSDDASQLMRLDPTSAHGHYEHQSLPTPSQHRDIPTGTGGRSNHETAIRHQCEYECSV